MQNASGHSARGLQGAPGLLCKSGHLIGTSGCVYTVHSAQVPLSLTGEQIKSFQTLMLVCKGELYQGPKNKETYTVEVHHLRPTHFPYTFYNNPAIRKTKT